MNKIVDTPFMCYVYQLTDPHFMVLGGYLFQELRCAHTP